MDPDLIEAVWSSARKISGWDPIQWRQDQCGAWMHRDQLENELSQYGWKIVRVAPGSDERSGDLRAFHRENGFDIASGRPHCRVTRDREALAPGQRVDRPRNMQVRS